MGSEKVNYGIEISIKKLEMKKRFFTKLVAIVLLIPFTSCSGSERSSAIGEDDSKMITEFSLPLGGNAFSSIPLCVTRNKGLSL